MTTATVETLTAEVRVLMVGNRQVTLSVAKQLDRVHPMNRQFTPMGRIRIASGRMDAWTQRLVVIGRWEDGNLVVAEWPDRPYGASRDASPQQAAQDNGIRAAYEAHLRLPLIVLAGLR